MKEKCLTHNSSCPIGQMFCIWSLDLQKHMKQFRASFSQLWLPKDTTAWVTYKQQTFLLHCSRGQEPTIRVPAWSGSGEAPFLGCKLMTLAVSLHGGRGKLALWDPFLKGTFIKALNHLPEIPPPNAITLGTRFSTYEFGRNTNIQTIAGLLSFNKYFLIESSHYCYLWERFTPYLYRPQHVQGGHKLIRYFYVCLLSTIIVMSH